MGKTGKAIIEAIVDGERNAENFIPFVDCRIKTDKATIVKSLQGNWREEHLFTLRESYRFYTFYLQEIKTCDIAIENQLIHYEAFIQDGNIEEQQSQPISKFKKTSKNGPGFNMVHYLQRIHQVNVMAIYGLSDIGAWEYWLKLEQI